MSWLGEEDFPKYVGISPEKITTTTKGTLSGHVGILVKIQTLTMSRKITTGIKGTVVSLTPFATHLTFYFYYVCTLKEEISPT
jgi:hypothetical protein